MKKSGFVALVAGVMVGVVSQSALAEEIRIEGGGAAISAIFSPMKEQFEKTTGIKLTLIQSTPLKGLIALERGQVDAATAAHPLKNIIRRGAKEGVTIDPASLKEVEVAQSQILVFLHKANKIPKITRDQLQGIFTGHITNWKQLGGDDQIITVVWGINTPGQNAHFTEQMLDGEEVTKNAVLVDDYKSIRDTVAATPGAIGIDPSGFVTSNVNVPDIPVMPTPIIVVTRGESSAKVKQLMKFYDEEYGIFRR